MFGWAGRLIKIDLSKGNIDKEPLNPDFAQNFLGGLGFANKIIFAELDPRLKEDPFGPNNVVCIMPGTFCGILVPGASRLCMAVMVHPFAGTFSHGNAGGHFGPELKYAGYDGIIIRVWLFSVRNPLIMVAEGFSLPLLET